MEFFTDLFKKIFGPGIDLKQLVADGAKIIDVRSPGEFVHGRIKEAVNIPHSIIGANISKVTNDKSQCIIVYCTSGSRSGVARGTLEKAGYTHVVNGRTLSRMRRQLG